MAKKNTRFIILTLSGQLLGLEENTGYLSRFALRVQTASKVPPGSLLLSNDIGDRTWRIEQFGITPMVASPEYVEQVLDLCRRATEANQQLANRSGNVVSLTSRDGEDLVLAADLHGQRLNFRRICELADLDHFGRRHLIMQEVCHGGPEYPSGQGCMSHLLLEDVARLKVRFPTRFHFLLSNHEMAELADFPIAKGRRMLNLHFRGGVLEQYGEQGTRVLSGYLAFLASCPLAVRLNGTILICHSAPEGVDRRGFDETVFHRALTRADMLPEGPAFRLVWGRDYRAANAEAFARMMGAEILIHGHAPCRNGYNVPNSIQVILDSCGPRPCYLMLPMNRSLTQKEVVERIQPLS